MPVLRSIVCAQRAPSRPLRREIASLVDGVKMSAAASPANPSAAARGRGRSPGGNAVRGSGGSPAHDPVLTASCSTAMRTSCSTPARPMARRATNHVRCGQANNRVGAATRVRHCTAPMLTTNGQHLCGRESCFAQMRQADNAHAENIVNAAAIVVPEEAQSSSGKITEKTAKTPGGVTSTASQVFSWFRGMSTSTRFPVRKRQRRMVRIRQKAARVCTRPSMYARTPSA
mmetsp:Transcript_8653/g.25286  ORF Transcript_8653/g.25286 Transcript_8653/m.25286 type:complete len:230 (-) Transcript_8653:2727-3416(-)